jgi:hypothetical protein
MQGNQIDYFITINGEIGSKKKRKSSLLSLTGKYENLE